MDVLISRPDSLGSLLLQAGDVNPFNLKPHSNKYKEIFKTRQGLPVHKQMAEFLEMFSSVRPSPFLSLNVGGA